MKPKMPERFACPFCQTWCGAGFNYLPHMQVYVCYRCAEKHDLAQIKDDEINNRIEPKWSQDQVDSLSSYQKSLQFFPFVCQQGDIFEATSVGLFCPKCEQILKWAYDWTLDWSWQKEIRF